MTPGRLAAVRCFFLASLCASPLAWGAEFVVPLYDGQIPGAIEAPDEESVRDPSEAFPFLQNVSRPTLSVFLPAERSGPVPAVVVLPGGSYRGVSVVKEGAEVAKRFNDLGVAAIVVKYRSPNARYMTMPSEAPIQDAREALRRVRAHAKEWGIDADRVALIGFSAGGHAAAMAATRRIESGNAVPDSALPSLLLLIYPVITLIDPYAHATSRRQLLGESPSPEQLRSLSPNLLVSDATPPTFLVHASDDTSVPVQNSLLFHAALLAHKVPAELHVYASGGHGFGLRNPSHPESWFDRCAAWLASRGWIAK